MSAAPADSSATVGAIAARLERLPSSRWQAKVLILLGTVVFFEGFDQMLVSYTLPLIKEEWSLSSFEQTAAVTAGSVGMLIGALLCGMLADRFGRVRMVVIAILITAISSLLLMVSTDFVQFVVLRFVQGLGIGGEVPVAAAFVSEIAKAKGRGRFVLLYELAFPAGLTAAAVIATAIVPQFGWRALYLIGAIPAILAFLVHRKVPESPRWLAARGDFARAEQAMRAMEEGVRKATARPLPPPVPHDDVPAESRGRIRDLIGRKYLRRTTIVAVLWFCGYFVNYGLTAWLPTIYTSVYQIPLQTALNYTLYTSLFGFGGCVLVMLLVDRIGRKPALIIGLGVGGLLLIVLAMLGAASGLAVALWCSVSALFIFAANICLYVYTAELYPTRVRALGVSMGGAWNRVGVILGPIVVGGLIAAGASIAVVFAVLGGVGVAAGLVAFLGEETAGRRLEEISR
ncbi:putative MFS transporter [Tamaricihabitans halophyticus]|uniref:Putative MFS transporter n=1 Tax=Tamaricihabitans halophyticus TaxID=1262583 RepID=A0A4R2QFM3_9PSEU|nr:MFS transporter [Tamaricihabitans halophyticus]TCP45805.1 putative MFS transporter [Tamaricihabitans halophyticus]